LYEKYAKQKKVLKPKPKGDRSSVRTAYMGVHNSSKQYGTEHF